MKSITLENLTYYYPRTGTPALDSVNLQVDAGALMCLVGPSGCGKTTLLKLVSGLLYPHSGRVRFGDEDVTDTAPENRRAVMVFQSHLLFPFMSVLDNVAFALKMQGIATRERRERARIMLDRVRLGGFEDRRPSSLSAGQRQRVALGRALIADPAVLLLDEPLSNLDRHLREDMRLAIMELQRDSEVTTICVTHDQEEAVLLGDRIAMLSSGRVVQSGTAQEFYERPASSRVAVFFGNNNHIDGVLSGEIVSSELGSFAVDRAHVKQNLSDGTVRIHIRPESIELRAPCSGRQNCIRARVSRRVYVGTHVKYVVDVDGQPWQVVASPLAPSFAEGDEVSLYLPTERIWITEQ